MLPYFLKHYSKFCDLMTFYDDNSTDNSVSIIKSFPNTEVLPQYDTPNDRFDDQHMLNLKNNAWKKDRDFDWVIVVDVDEFLYHPDLLKKLEEYKNSNVTVPLTTGYDMYGKVFPSGEEQIYDQIKLGRHAGNHSKKVIFNPRYVDINYDIGCHTCNPLGQVGYSLDNEFKVLHYVYPSHEYMTTRRKMIFERLSELNKENGWSTHNDSYSKMTEEEYNNLEPLMSKII